MKTSLYAVAIWMCALGAQVQPATQKSTPTSSVKPTKVVKSEDEWKKLLTPEQYYITRQCGTEPPFKNAYYNFKGKGMYKCVACKQTLFSSEAKYDSGSGWPSFFAPQDQKAIQTKVDKSHGMVRTEIKCSKCDAHLGHVFDDGPDTTGLRYCTNSASLIFEPSNDSKK